MADGSYDPPLTTGLEEPDSVLALCLELPSSVSFDHLYVEELALMNLSELDSNELTYILTFLSSPAEANMQGSAGFHATALTQPVEWPSSVSIKVPFSLCQMYTLESGKN